LFAVIYDFGLVVTSIEMAGKQDKGKVRENETDAFCSAKGEHPKVSNRTRRQKRREMIGNALPVAAEESEMRKPLRRLFHCESARTTVIRLTLEIDIFCSCCFRFFVCQANFATIETSKLND
jgi:hypothetical protein